MEARLWLTSLLLAEQKTNDLANNCLLTVNLSVDLGDVCSFNYLKNWFRCHWE